jgi:DNA-binding response OmpR family regulator
MAKILVVDRDEAFATLLKEILEVDGGHQVRVAPRGRDGLALLQRERFDLTVIDMDQEQGDVNYITLMKGVRHLDPGMRIVLIPLMGEAVPDEAHQLNIQGALSKPFFVDDLLPRIDDALSRVVQPQKIEQTADAVPISIGSVLSELARETQADIVLLASMAGEKARVLHHVSVFDEDRLQHFADLLVKTAKVGQAAAHFLGQPNEPYEHNMFENQDSRLYVMVLPGERLVAVVTPIRTPLGTIRHNLRRASREIAGTE